MWNFTHATADTSAQCRPPSLYLHYIITDLLQESLDPRQAMGILSYVVRVFWHNQLTNIIHESIHTLCVMKGDSSLCHYSIKYHDTRSCLKYHNVVPMVVTIIIPFAAGIIWFELK